MTAYTIDIETLALPDYRERVGPQLERALRLGNMRLEQLQRYLEDIAAEEERCYQLGSLSAISGRVLCIAVHVGPVAGEKVENSISTGSDSDRVNTGIPHGEYVFGIDAEGNEQKESDSLESFLSLIKSYNPDTDEIVGHNILSFDLPFLFQRCLINNIPVRAYVDPDVVCARGVFDTMHRWWLGARRNVSLDDLAWALGIASSKTPEVEGSKVFDLYQAGRLAEIRDYNLNDVRVTRKVYERLVAYFGR